MKRRLFLYAILTGLFVSCEEGDEVGPTDNDKGIPTAKACFEYSPESEIKAGDGISFTNCSENATTYAWDFGDGDVSTEKSPVHAYETAGEYTVMLIASNESEIDTIFTSVNVESSGPGYFSYGGATYPLQRGEFKSIIFGDDTTGRYHEVLLFSENVSTNPDMPGDIKGSGKYVQLWFTTDVNHIGNIIGEYNKDKIVYNSTNTSADNYSWTTLRLLEEQNSSPTDLQIYVEERVDSFTITKTGEIYEISISGQGTSTNDNGSGLIRIYYKGPLSFIQ